jgi:hypothetical protein
MSLKASTRLIDEVRATLAADPTNEAALRNLVRLETIPAMERDLAAEYAKPRPDRAAIAALTEEIRSLHRGDPLPDHIRFALLAR